MNKKGFTLVELLFVLVIVSIISVSAIVIFNQTSEVSSEEKTRNAYLDIQRAAKLYIDLNDSWVKQFNERDRVYIAIGELESKNYVSTSLGDMFSEEEIPSYYLVEVYVTNNGKGFVDTCVIDAGDDGESSTVKCIADSDGNINPNKNICCKK